MAMRILGFFVLMACLGVEAPAAPGLDIYFVDVEGGQSTSIVTPAGESLLVDTGSQDFNGRDPRRIVEAAHRAQIQRIDYLIITHFHSDHVGGVPELAERIPIATFIDHGPGVESGKEADELAAGYLKAVAKSKHRVVKPGDYIPLRGVNVEVLTANGEQVAAPLPGAGQPNPFCSAVTRQQDDPSENARSTGILLTFGKFRFIDLGDLTWNKELDLMCPSNRVGRVDVYLTSHHGLSISGSSALVWALHPRVAIMNNGARKGGEPEAWQVLKDSPGLEDLWQLHYSIDAGKAHNAADRYIANEDEKCQGNYLKLSARPDGSFTVTNSRNGFARTYAAR